MDLETIATPALLLDVERLGRNAARIGNRVRDLGARLRPHVKTHKSIEVDNRVYLSRGQRLCVSWVSRHHLRRADRTG